MTWQAGSGSGHVSCIRQLQMVKIKEETEFFGDLGRSFAAKGALPTSKDAIKVSFRWRASMNRGIRLKRVKRVRAAS